MDLLDADYWGRTCMHMAVFNNHLSTVRSLLTRNRCDDTGCKPGLQNMTMVRIQSILKRRPCAFGAFPGGVNIIWIKPQKPRKHFFFFWGGAIRLSSFSKNW